MSADNGGGPPEVTESPSDKVTEVDLAVKGTDYSGFRKPRKGVIGNVRDVMQNPEFMAEARRAEDERVRLLAYNDGWAKGFLYGLSVGIGIFTLAALFTLWSIMP